MEKDDKAFFVDNKETLKRLFGEIYESEKERIFLLPQGQERDTQIEFVRFLKDWLYKIEVFSRPAQQENKSFI